MVGVGSGVLVGVIVGMDAKKVAVAESPADCTVMAMTVGRYSGGYGVGTELVAGDAHPATSPRNEARKIKSRFIRKGDLSTSPTGLSFDLLDLSESISQLKLTTRKSRCIFLSDIEHRVRL